MAQSDTSRLSRYALWRRRALWALWALGVWALLCGLGWLALPPLLKWQLEKQGSAALGRQVSVEKLDIRPWSLELAVHGLRIGAADGAPAGSPPLLTAQRVYIDAELQSLLRWAPVIDALVLEQPRVHLAHWGEGRYSIDDVLSKLMQPTSKPSQPPRFAVYNIRVSGGELDLDDQPEQAQHQLRSLELHVPFLSNLASRRDVATQPKLAFVLNGSAFETTASSTPFAAQPHAEVHLHVPALALGPYLTYWPEKWPLRPTQGQLEARLTLTFDQKDTPQVRLGGQIALSNLAVTTQTGNPLFGWQKLALDVADLRPLERVVQLKQVTWTAPDWHVRRGQDGQLQWAQLLEAWTSPPQTTTPQTPPPPAWHVGIHEVLLEQGTVRWHDTSTQPAARLALEDLNLRAGPLQWPAGSPTPFAIEGRVGSIPVSLQGEGSPSGARAELSWKEAPLALAQPYLAQVLTPALQGRLTATLALNWAPPTGQQAQVLAINAPRLSVSDLTIGDPQKPQLAWSELVLEQLRLDLTTQRLQLDRLTLNQPKVALERDTQGRWMFDRWLVAPSSAPAAPAASPAGQPSIGVASSRTDTARPWDIQLKQLQVQKGAGTWVDHTTGRPVRLQWRDLNLAVQNLQPLSNTPTNSPLKVSLQVGGQRGDPGTVTYDGLLRLPSSATTGTHLKGSLGLNRLPLHPLEPYLADQLNLDLVRADLGYQGELEVGTPATGLALQLVGQASLEDFRASTVNPSEELLDWKSLQLRGLQLVVQSGELHRLQVGETVLSDYYARVVVDNTGRINLQNLIKSPTVAAAPSTPPSTANAVLPAAPAASKPLAPIEFGPITLVNGRVYFSDRFIKPNYSANLSELTGRLGAFSNLPSSGSNTINMAELDLRGRAEGTASLQINGRLNPLAQPLALDIKGVVRELELPPLSPYSVKYAGYGIDRGKLSVDVAYKVAPNGQLEASNQIVLNQLRFGERVEGSEAPNLPVKLAVALLADRNGVIDINLPISGSLNDPEFRIGSIVFKLVLNLIGKAITSPFALIASALGGGGEDLQEVVFPPGRAQLDAQGVQRLERVAQALLDRPALQLTVTGRSALEAEKEGYRRARLEALVAAEKRRRDARAGQTPTTTAPSSAEEYPALLRTVYRRSDITKPRNALGLTKDLTVPEMEALLLASIPVNEDAMRDLAVARGVAVKDQLALFKVPLDRLFLGAPTVDTGTETRATALKLEPR
ncbi:MAG: hypothetical protein RJA09_399 [Pseudomonadota bacterium]